MILESPVFGAGELYWVILKGVSVTLIYMNELDKVIETPVSHWYIVITKYWSKPHQTLIYLYWGPVYRLCKIKTNKSLFQNLILSIQPLGGAAAKFRNEGNWISENDGFPNRQYILMYCNSEPAKCWQQIKNLTKACWRRDNERFQCNVFGSISMTLFKH